MFEYHYPLFEKKRILRAEMLEQLRDYPKDLIQLSFDGFGNGIVKGCEISWEKDCLTIHKGMIYYNGNLYFLRQPYELECKANDRLRYVKVQFLTEVVEIGKVSGSTRILLEEKEVDEACELELGRFRLQEGARLRDCYEDFEDYSTRYDTVNRIYAPYAVLGGTTLQPDIIKSFAKEMLQKQVSDPYDISFALLVLGNEGKVGIDCIKQYLQIKMKQNISMKNEEVYDCFLQLLKKEQENVQLPQREVRGNKNILLI